VQWNVALASRFFNKSMILCGVPWALEDENFQVGEQ
jgi:hypothetical protein